MRTAVQTTASTSAVHATRVAAKSSSTVFGRPVTHTVSKTPANESRRSLVVYAKGKGKRSMRMGGNPQTQPMRPPTPPVDPNNEEFVIFVKSKVMPQWYPYSIMKGGWQANALVKSQENDWGKKLYGETLVKNVGDALYQEYGKVVASVRQNYPMLKQAKELEFGFKVRDKTKPEDWYKPSGIQVIPPKEEMPKNLVDNVKDFFTFDKK